MFFAVICLSSLDTYVVLELTFKEDNYTMQYFMYQDYNFNPLVKWYIAATMYFFSL